MISKYAPIVLFCYLRKDHLEKTLDALSKNILASESEIFIFSDGAKNVIQHEKVKEIRVFLKNYKYQSKFKKYVVFESEENRGLADSIINGVEKIIKKYERVIVLEDDLVSSKYFLNYMNDTLDKFKLNKKIWSISGYGPQLKKNNNNKNNEYYFLERPWSWGWGTWNDRWQLTKWENLDFKALKSNTIQFEKFNDCGKDLGEMLRSQSEKRAYINSWYIRFAYSQFLNNGITIYPKKSFIKNIGIDGTGTHSSKKNSFRWDVEINENYSKGEIEVLDKIFIDESIKKYFRKLGHINYKKGLLMRILDDFKLYSFARKIQKKIENNI